MTDSITTGTEDAQQAQDYELNVDQPIEDDEVKVSMTFDKNLKKNPKAPLLVAPGQSTAVAEAEERAQHNA